MPRRRAILYAAASIAIAIEATLAAVWFARRRRTAGPA
jgi:hypothetical protein